jgi:uncharacterized membrane protein (TIGR02234 family)
VPQQGGRGAAGDRHGVDAALAVTATRRGPRTGSRSRLLSALVALAGAGLLVVTAGRPWVSRIVTDVPGVTQVTASGDRAAPAAPALALVAAAAAAAVLVTGRWGRRVAAVVLLLAGIGALAAVAAVVLAPADAVAGVVAAATGRTGPVAGPPPAVTGWVWLALAAALLVAGGGLAAVLRAGSWPAPGRRFEAARAGAPRPADAPRADGKDDAIGAWDALSRGDDPTR